MNVNNFKLISSGKYCPLWNCDITRDLLKKLSSRNVRLDLILPVLRLQFVHQTEWNFLHFSQIITNKLVSWWTNKCSSIKRGHFSHNCAPHK